MVHDILRSAWNCKCRLYIALTVFAGETQWKNADIPISPIRPIDIAINPLRS